ncbi:hypothetical protein PPL_01357 [Heterostelium album PN500]|uniref:Tudor domain-containing protein n=1 Tax=Heterostelium pallidum (strain ATCC 26659 / Pp 5 / PN500) TaxID=670386 RepID=D3AZ17_HETP5|nr:hypothetical protein PPL_01357 [Heterostelium album PN500]EFA85574.1 hypothetical protein PPL_01357 [Heterostelium album PN500]|eukprot:XP_020437681.1 hypothetical protein PPL_01357 [Heterostelium album PN500]
MADIPPTENQAETNVSDNTMSITNPLNATSTTNTNAIEPTPLSASSAGDIQSATSTNVINSGSPSLNQSATSTNATNNGSPSLNQSATSTNAINSGSPSLNQSATSTNPTNGGSPRTTVTNGNLSTTSTINNVPNLPSISNTNKNAPSISNHGTSPNRNVSTNSYDKGHQYHRYESEDSNSESEDDYDDDNNHQDECSTPFLNLFPDLLESTDINQQNDQCDQSSSLNDTPVVTRPFVNMLVDGKTYHRKYRNSWYSGVIVSVNPTEKSAIIEYDEGLTKEKLSFDRLRLHRDSEERDHFNLGEMVTVYDERPPSARAKKQSKGVQTKKKTIKNNNNNNNKQIKSTKTTKAIKPTKTTKEKKIPGFLVDGIIIGSTVDKTKGIEYEVKLLDSPSRGVTKKFSYKLVYSYENFSQQE